MSESLRPYWNYGDELSVQNGIIYKGTQVMRPQSMHKEMFCKFHANHFGAESTVCMALEVLRFFEVLFPYFNLGKDLPGCFGPLNTSKQGLLLGTVSGHPKV